MGNLKKGMRVRTPGLGLKGEYKGIERRGHITEVQRNGGPMDIFTKDPPIPLGKRRRRYGMI